MNVKKKKCSEYDINCTICNSKCIDYWSYVTGSDLRNIGDFLFENTISYVCGKDDMIKKILEHEQLTIEELNNKIKNSRCMTCNNVYLGEYKNKYFECEHKCCKKCYMEQCKEKNIYCKICNQLNDVIKLTSSQVKKNTKLIDNTTNIQTKKTIIPIGVKNQTWTTYIGKVFEIECPICNINIINICNFECAHVTAQSKDGQHTVDNLRPICSPCNKRMNNNDFYEWTKKNYPKAKILESFITS
jgi:hypothetical protein